MTTTSIADVSKTFASIGAAISAASEGIRAFGRQMAIESRRIDWDLAILLADDPKRRRRLRRDMAREYRRPSLIHNGGKP
ncbi:hypothetical protein AHiyo6_04010 [Arthrobacter sp. Hiyo6]|nr:hypothetical protein AHiyo6_04010 [Arthrobacter sp. Hiyo6]